jgi:RHS repeat-associated protein
MTMGYSLITESERAPGARSHVSPKTHTPLSRLQERGSRFHSPTLGRWISRDPIGELGVFSGDIWKYVSDTHDRLEGYVFVGNNGVSAVDVLGAVTYSTRRLEGDANGQFNWLIKWEHGAEELDGWIVQEVEYRIVSRSCKSGLWLTPLVGHIYEAWEVTRGEISPNSFDEWKSEKDFGACTYGSVWAHGKHAFVWTGRMPPPTGLPPSECKGAPWCSSAPPWFWGLSRPWISGYNERTLLGFWDSCTGESDTDLSIQ